MLILYRQGKSMQTSVDSLLVLSNLISGEKAVIHQVSLGKTSSNRLLSLGFTPGVEILMLQNYGQGPLVVNVRGTRVALGRGEAAKIHIKKVE
jgi:ferrous iron transport protein A